ncbi:hypothetical protein ABTZ99_13510 [Actinosynnema sp. NPDC002837]
MSKLHTRNALRLRALLEAAPTRRWTLPSAVADAYRTTVRLSEALAHLDQPVYPWEDHVEAALASKTPAKLDVSGLVDHDRAEREYLARAEVLTAAAKRADDTLSKAVDGQRDRIIREFLAPAGGRLWVDIVAAVNDLGEGPPPGAGADVRAKWALQAGERERAAYARLDDETGLAREYVELRTAWSMVVGPDPEHDYSGDHAEFEAGLCTVWPGRSRGWVSAPTTPPWPDNTRDRLVWLVRNGHEPWWPTRAEQDAAWRAVHGNGKGLRIYTEGD